MERIRKLEARNAAAKEADRQKRLSMEVQNKDPNQKAAGNSKVSVCHSSYSFLLVKR
jgi:hypothetical protein